MRPKLQIVVGSTRPGRVGLPVGRWFEQVTRADGRFAVDFVDLAEIALPLLDEPNHPRLRQYTKPHTFAWSERVDSGDAYVFVTPEYNHGMNAALKNAIDFLHQEWGNKPVGFVSYGGPAAGVRAVEQLKQTAAALRLVPAFRGVEIPSVHRLVSDGRIAPTEQMAAEAARLLDELVTLEAALRPLRLSAAR